MPRLPPRYDVPRAAPPPLDLVQALVNSRDHENDREWLGSDGDLRAWLAARDLPAEGGSVERFLAVREALRLLLIANNERRPAPAGALRTLNAEAARSPLVLRFAAEGAALEGTDALAAVLAAVHAGMADGSWARLKACRNCHWAFYDESKNRSATWCSMQLCGNRLKTRRFRSRHA